MSLEQIALEGGKERGWEGGREGGREEGGRDDCYTYYNLIGMFNGNTTIFK